MKKTDITQFEGTMYEKLNSFYFSNLKNLIRLNVVRENGRIIGVTLDGAQVENYMSFGIERFQDVLTVATFCYDFNQSIFVYKGPPSIVGCESKMCAILESIVQERLDEGAKK